MDLLSPEQERTVKDRKTWDKITFKVPIYERYAEIQKEMDEAKEGENAYKVKMDLFGPDLHMTYPDLYSDIAMLRELNVLAVWHTFDAHKQARITAQYRLEKMESLIRRYTEITSPKKK